MSNPSIIYWQTHNFQCKSYRMVWTLLGRGKKCERPYDFFSSCNKIQNQQLTRYASSISFFIVFLTKVFYSAFLVLYFFYPLLFIVHCFLPIYSFHILRLYSFDSCKRCFSLTFLEWKFFFHLIFHIFEPCYSFSSQWLIFQKFRVPDICT